MAVDAAGLSIDTYRGDLASSASIAGADGQLALQMNAPQEILTKLRWDCTTGDSGRYYASLSPDEQTLTLTLTSDNCATRGEILTGDWTRWTCQYPAHFAYCSHVSELSPGRYVSPVFRPFWGSALHEGPATGQLAYTVPAGWAMLSQPPTWPQLGTQSMVGLTQLDAPGSEAIRVYSRTFATYPSAVPDGSTPEQCVFGYGSIGSNGTAIQVADFLGSQPYLSVSGREPLTIGGLTGVQIDMSLVPGFFDPCLSYSNATQDGSTSQPIHSTEIQLFADVDPDGGGISLDYEGDAFARLILLDTANGREVIAVSAPDAASLEARVAETMPVIESFEFIP